MGEPSGPAVVELAGRPVGAFLFDKDGTLLDFHRTWDRALGATLRALAPDQHALEEAARAVEFDLSSDRIAPSSPVIAESNAVIMGILDPLLDTSRFEAVMTRYGTTEATPTPGAAGFLELLAARSVPMGVVTNDSELTARHQIEHLGWSALLPVVVGYDSGHGAKPAGGPVRACARALGVDATLSVLVGDSHHDMMAARDAGAVAVYVGPFLQEVMGADLSARSLTELGALIH